MLRMRNHEVRRHVLRLLLASLWNAFYCLDLGAVIFIVWMLLLKMLLGRLLKSEDGRTQVTFVGPVGLDLFWPILTIRMILLLLGSDPFGLVNEGPLVFFSQHFPFGS